MDSATIFYQDNTSSILLERNGLSSSTKQTKHMNIQYIYVTEHIKKKTIHVTHCPTEEMVGDFFTKPLQGSLFIKMHNYIMGSEEPGYQVLPRSVLSKHNMTSIRKRKYIGTRKHDSEAVAKTSHKHVAKDSDGSTKDVPLKNIRGTTLNTVGGDERSIEHDEAGRKQHGDKNDVVEPRSYRDVLVNGEERQKLMT